MNLQIEAPNKEESEQYFTLCQSLDCNEDHGLRNNMKDQYSQSKISGNGRLNVIEDLEEQFNESIYLNAQ